MHQVSNKLVNTRQNIASVLGFLKSETYNHRRQLISFILIWLQLAGLLYIALLNYATQSALAQGCTSVHYTQWCAAGISLWWKMLPNAFFTTMSTVLPSIMALVGFSWAFGRNLFSTMYPNPLGAKRSWLRTRLVGLCLYFMLVWGLTIAEPLWWAVVAVNTLWQSTLWLLITDIIGYFIMRWLPTPEEGLVSRG